jgi:hypothetical protein
MKKLIYIVLIIATACSTVKELPQNTAIASILKLKPGMDIDSTKKTLQTDPWDVIKGGDSLLVVFNYKHMVYNRDKMFDCKGKLNCSDQLVYGMQAQLICIFYDNRLISWRTINLKNNIKIQK